MKHLAPLLFLSALSATEPTAAATSTPGLVHAMAGIWHEGTDLKQKETSDIAKVERGQRQYALFAGLNKPGSGCGHVSENCERIASPRSKLSYAAAKRSRVISLP